ncbi:MAG: class I SAM-dependent methyltransferase [Planctomycetota bacterium]
MGDASFACKVCGASAPRLLTLRNDLGPPHALDLACCPSCGLVFVGTPIPPDRLSAAYAGVDWDAYYEQVHVTDRAKAARSAEDLQEWLTPGQAVLDVGCGSGYLLEELQGRIPALRVVGHELPGPLVETLRRRGFDTYDCELDRIPESFALATLLDVAEHVPDPVATFRAIGRRLDEDGRVYLHTPRRSFWDACFLKLARVPLLRRIAAVWIRMRVNIFHLQLWSDRSLALALDRAGFEVERLHAELELSWPLDLYARVWLERKLGLPAFVSRVATWVADLVLVRCRTMRNKAVVVARKRAGAAASVRAAEGASV